MDEKCSDASDQGLSEILDAGLHDVTNLPIPSSPTGLAPGVNQVPLPDFIEDFLSPDNEFPSHGFPSTGASFPPISTASLEDPNLLAVFPSSASNRSMENITLEGAGMEESIDLGVSSYLEATEDITSDIELKDDLDQGLEDQGLEDQGLEDTLTDEHKIGGVAPEDKLLCEIEAEELSGLQPLPVPSVQHAPSDVPQVDVTNGNNSSNSLLDEGIIDTTKVVLVDSQAAHDSSVGLGEADEMTEKLAESVHSMKVVTEEAVDVGFVVEDEKKSDDTLGADSTLSTMSSSKSLMNFFAAANSAGGTDIEGKNFFDSFSTGIEEPVVTKSDSFQSQQGYVLTDSNLAASTGGTLPAGSAVPVVSTPPSDTFEQKGLQLAVDKLPAADNSFIQTSNAFSGLPTDKSGLAADNKGTDYFNTSGLTSQASLDRTASNDQLTSFKIADAFGLDVSSVAPQAATSFFPSTSLTGLETKPIPPSPRVVCQEPRLDFGWQTPSPSVTGVSLEKAAANTEDENRRYDAWIPSDATRFVLSQILSNQVVQTPFQLCRPGVLSADLLGDPIYDLVIRTMGEQEANKRLVLNADSVPQDDVGLRQLIKSDCLRSAVDLSARLLTSQCGQGLGQMGQPSQHTPYSLQLWFTRLAVMVRLRLFSQAEAEFESFGSLDSPDLYYQYHHEHFPLRTGCMVPFGMRLLHAELPNLCGKSHESLDRLYHMISVINKILDNLSKGFTEDASAKLNNESIKNSTELWTSRRIQVLYSVGSTLVTMKDYTGAIEVYSRLLSEDSKNKSSLHSGLARICLQMGDIANATSHFESSEALMDSSLNSAKCQISVNRGLLALGANQYTEAFQHFKAAIDLDPTNVMAVNNMAVCQLYLGSLGLALQTLETLIFADPMKHLQESTVLNLCTLYELESSKALQKKQRLLCLINQQKGNGFNVGCLKMS